MNAHDILVAARGLLMNDGWCTDILFTDDGQHCAVGAVCQSILPATSSEWQTIWGWREMNQQDHPVLVSVLQALVDAIPEEDRPDYESNWEVVASYNNSRNGFVDILAMFDTAIERTALVDA